MYDFNDLLSKLVAKQSWWLWSQSGIILFESFKGTQLFMSSFPFEQLLCIDTKLITVFSSISIIFAILMQALIFRICSKQFKQLHVNITKKRFKSINGNEVNETLLVKYYDIQKNVVQDFIDNPYLVELIFSFIDCTPDHQEKQLLTQLSRQYHYPYIKSIAIQSSIYSLLVIISQLCLLTLIIISYYKWYNIQIQNGSTMNAFHFYIAFANCLLILQPHLRIFKFVEFYLQEKYRILPQICKRKKFISILLYSGLNRQNWRNNHKRINFGRILKGLFVIQIGIITIVAATTGPFLVLAVLLLSFLWGTIFCFRPLWQILSALLRRIGDRFSLIVFKLAIVLLLGLSNEMIWTSVRNTSENWYSTRIIVKNCDNYPTEYTFTVWKYLSMESILILFSWIIL